MTVVIVSGLMLFVSGTLVCMLSESSGPHDGGTPPTLLLSYLMVIMFSLNGIVEIVFRLNFMEIQVLWSWLWTAFVYPKDYMDYILTTTNCVCTLDGHLATALGYSTTQIPWVYLLDILALNRSTTEWKSIGGTAVFVRAVAVAVL